MLPVPRQAETLHDMHEKEADEQAHADIHREQCGAYRRGPALREQSRAERDAQGDARGKARDQTLEFLAARPII